MSGDSGREPVCPRRETMILACQRRKLSAAFPKSGAAVLVRKQLANPRQVSTVVPGSAPACCARKTRQAQRRVCMTASIEESNFQHFSAPDASPHANIEAASARAARSHLATSSTLCSSRGHGAAATKPQRAAQKPALERSSRRAHRAKQRRASKGCSWQPRSQTMGSNRCLCDAVVKHTTHKESGPH